jgi:RNA polymerase sigma-70 factor (ECF subfamily)
MTIRRRRHNTVSINDLTNPDSDAAAIEMEDSRPTPEQQCAQLELRSALIDSVLQLRPSLRAAILLHEFRDFSTAETAHLLGISVCAAKVRLFYARSKLREDLGPRLSLRSTRSRESDFVRASSSGITEMAALPTGHGV